MALPSLSIAIQNPPLLTMSFAVTLVQATITTCLCSCYSLLMLPPSVITVPGVSLLKGKSGHVTPGLQAADGFLSPSEKSQSLYNNLQVPTSLGLSLMSFPATFPLLHSAVATQTCRFVLKQAGLFLPQGLCTHCST